MSSLVTPLQLKTWKHNLVKRLGKRATEKQTNSIMSDRGGGRHTYARQRGT
jgi:hypothetical protein